MLGINIIRLIHIIKILRSDELDVRNSPLDIIAYLKSKIKEEIEKLKNKFNYLFIIGIVGILIDILVFITCEFNYVFLIIF